MQASNWNTMGTLGAMALKNMDRSRKARGDMLDRAGYGPQQTPSTVLHTEPGLNVRRYGAPTDIATNDSPAVLIVPAPIKRPYIWDLAPDVSVVRRFLERGELDFTDARSMALARLRDPERGAVLGRALAARFLELIVDEAQDCNPVDLEIIDWLRAAGVPVVPVGDAVLSEMTETVTPQGLLAVCHVVDRPLPEVLSEVLAQAPGRRPALVPVLVQVRDPGNAGTVLRAADAAGAGGALGFTACTGPSLA